MSESSVFQVALHMDAVLTYRVLHVVLYKEIVVYHRILTWKLCYLFLHVVQ